MRTHPELYLPEAKEQPFFTNDAAYEEGWEAFAAVAFHGAPPGRRYGKITPHYMSGPVVWASARPETRERRDRPADPRAVPGREADRDAPRPRRARDLELLADGGAGRRRALARRRARRGALGRGARGGAARPTDGHQHIVAGEYGRILDGVPAVFPREQLFVGSTGVLGSEPMALLRELWRFLGVDDSHVPPNLGVRYQVRGTGRRIRALGALPRVVKGTPGCGTRGARSPTARGRAPADACGPSRTAWTSGSRRAPSRWMQRPDPAVIARLRTHYAADAALLERLVGPVPGVTDVT